MEEPEGLLDHLADAILDGDSIDWASLESRADDTERPLLDPFRVLAALADVHRFRTVLDFEPGADAHRSADLRGEIVGSFALMELLGRGGMGEVYLAKRADGRFDQQVAVKLVKRGMDSREILQRFRRERRILARLQHPGIARLLDAGETDDGRPYFVMERVEGQRITDYCRVRDLPLEDRLKLVASCCDAVDSAHRSLVVHRDLKPSNLLVTLDGQVKLLDFGIAMLLEENQADTHRTAPGGLLTPAYAAPEQILGGDVSVATDVFALGVVLYELVTGALPFDRRATGANELATRVEHETAAPASTAVRATVTGGDESKRERWARRLRGDLDTIIAKALGHEPERRYASVAALADDLRRYLTSRPVQARPDATGYRLRKFVIRHRVGVAATALVIAVVLLALGVSLAQTAAARREADRAAAAQTFLVSMFEQIDPARYVGSAPTVRDLLERGSERLDRELAQQPELRAEMQALLGQVFDQLSLPEQGLAHWRRALETRQELFGLADARTARTRKGLAISLARQGRSAEADPIFRELLEHKAVLANNRELGSVLLNYGNLKRLTGDYPASQALLERAVSVLEQAEDPGRATLAAALGNLGQLRWRQGRLREAVAAMERTLAIHMKNHGERSSLVAYARKYLSHVHRDLGELDVAERYAQEALATGEALFPQNHPFIGTTLESLGQLAEKRGDPARARALYERSIASYAGSVRPDDPGIAYPLRYLGGLLLQAGDPTGAVRLYDRALAVRRKAYGDRHREVAESWADLARARLALNDTASALEALAEARAIWEKAPPSSRADLTELESAIAAARAARR